MDGKNTARPPPLPPEADVFPPPSPPLSSPSPPLALLPLPQPPPSLPLKPILLPPPFPLPFFPLYHLFPVPFPSQPRPSSATSFPSIKEHSISASWPNFLQLSVPRSLSISISISFYRFPPVIRKPTTGGKRSIFFLPVLFIVRYFPCFFVVANPSTRHNGLIAHKNNEESEKRNAPETSDK